MSESLRDLALKEASLKTLAALVKDQLDSVRERLQDELVAAKKAAGTKQIAAMLPDGTPVATISLPEVSVAAKVTDADAFLKWVVKNYPTEVERQFVTVVRGAFAERVLGEATAAGVAQFADKGTGELHDLPGVEIRPASSSSHRMTLRKDATALITEAWRAGTLPLPGNIGPALPPGGAS